MQPLPATEARSRFLKILKEAEQTLARFLIIHQGRPKAVLLSYEEFEAWQNTLELLQDPEWLLWAATPRDAGPAISWEQIRRRKAA